MVIEGTSLVDRAVGGVWDVLPGGLGREERGKKISETCSEPLACKAVDEEVQRAGSKDFLSSLILKRMVIFFCFYCKVSEKV